MKTILSLCLSLILLSCSSEKSCIENMVEIINQEREIYPGAFIVMDAKIGSKIQILCVSNRTLKWMIEKKFSTNNQDYVNYLKKFINHEDTLKLNADELSSNYFVEEDKELLLLYNQGIDSVRLRYFDENGVQKRQIPADKSNYLIALLFNNCIVSWIDDETGYMIIKEKYK